jgi:excisionase family DNA binding protein
MVTTSTNKLVYTTREAAEALQVSVATLRTWLREGKLPYVRYGSRKMLIPKQALEKALIDGALAGDAEDGVNR